MRRNRTEVAAVPSVRDVSLSREKIDALLDATYREIGQFKADIARTPIGKTNLRRRVVLLEEVAEQLKTARSTFKLEELMKRVHVD